jgi:hypothetical protein
VVLCGSPRQSTCCIVVLIRVILLFCGIVWFCHVVVTSSVFNYGHLTKRQRNKCTVILRLSHTLPQKVNRPTETTLRRLKGNFLGRVFQMGASQDGRETGRVS